MSCITGTTLRPCNSSGSYFLLNNILKVRLWYLIFPAAWILHLRVKKVVVDLFWKHVNNCILVTCTLHNMCMYSSCQNKMEHKETWPIESIHYIEGHWKKNQTLDSFFSQWPNYNPNDTKIKIPMSRECWNYVVEKL